MWQKIHISAVVWGGCLLHRSELYQFPRDVTTKDHKLGTWKNRNVLSYSSWGQKSEIKVLAEPQSLQSTWGMILPQLSESWAILIPWFMAATPPSLPRTSHAQVPSVFVCLCVSHDTFFPVFVFSSYKDTSHIRLGPTKIKYDLMLTCYICKDLISIHSDRYWEWRLPQIYFWGWWHNSVYSINHGS